MLILFQNRIIYMPSMPPFSRRERVSDYEGQCGGVGWREVRIRARDGVEVGVLVGGTDGGEGGVEEEEEEGKGLGMGIGERRQVVVLYFQGNGGSLPARLPGLSQVLRSLQKSSGKEDPNYTIVALSYRGFWTSKGRPSERGITRDAAAALDWISATFPENSSLVLWGQSLGAGVAAKAAAAYGSSGPSSDAALLGDPSGGVVRQLKVRGLILETPFTSVKDMLAAIYPQTWLPYRYLWPFLRSHWDSRQALSQIALQTKRPIISIMQAGRDELVPGEHGKELENICKDRQMEVSRNVIDGALHHEILFKPQGRAAVVDFLRRIGEPS